MVVSQHRTEIVGAPVRRIEQIDIVQGKKLKGRPKITWLEVITNDLKLLELEERMM